MCPSEINQAPIVKYFPWVFFHLGFLMVLNPYTNLFIYQARQSPARSRQVSDSPVSAENVILEAFVLIGGIG